MEVMATERWQTARFGLLKLTLKAVTSIPVLLVHETVTLCVGPITTTSEGITFRV